MPQATAVGSCPECEGSLRHEHDETVCAACGLVVAEDRLDRGPEWPAFDPARERTGAPLTPARHDRGLSTEIGRGSRRLPGRKRRRLARLRTHHNRAMIATKAERNRVYAFTEIRRIVSVLSLPVRTRDHACILFERAQNADLLRGRCLEGFTAAAVYAACRVESLSRTMTEVADATRATRDELKTAYDAMNRNLGLPTGPIDPREYLPRFATELDLPPTIEGRAHELARELTENDVATGRHPAGVAGACLYAAAVEHDHSLTQKRAANTAGVSPVTLRNTYYDIHDD